MPLALVTIASLSFFLGMIAIPQMFGVNPASATDWLGAAVGICSGAGLALNKVAQDREFFGEPIAL